MKEVIDYKNYIANEWKAFSKNKISVVNPFTEKEIAKIIDSDQGDVDSAVDSAKKAFESWRNVTPGERANLLLTLANLLEKDKERFAKLESQNQGKTIEMAKLDIDFSVDNLKFFAGACRSLETPAPGKYSKGYSILRRFPLGVVAAITPWNYPLNMACWKFAALAAGNTLILKPSSLTPVTTLELAKLSEKAGFPKGVINIITGSGENVGTMLAKHSGIDAISLTGSTETGKKIMAYASSTLKKVSLELGGKAPFIVFADCDLEKAAKTAVESSTVNSGQDCTAASRIYVEEKVYEKFLFLVKDYAKKIVLGNPSNVKTNLGPLVSKIQRERVAKFINERNTNEKIIYRSKTPRNGFFYPVTVIRDFEQKGNLCQREIFGPVIALSKFKTEEEVLRKANDVSYGLASSVWTNDIKRAIKFSENLDFGEVWINDHLPLVSEMPHGGLKNSGHGVDLSIKAIEEYTYLKHVYIGLQ